MIDSRNNRILFVLEHFHPYTGGVERLFYQLAVLLVEKGYEVNVISTRHCQELPIRENLNGINIRRIRANNRYLFTLMAIPAVVSSALKCRLIQTSTYNAAIPAFVAGILTRRPVIITVHEVWGNLWFNLPWMNKSFAWFHHLFEMFILRLPFRRFVAVSEHTAMSLTKAGVKPGKVEVIMNGIDYEWLKQFKTVKHNAPSDFKFIYFGRLGHSKGIDLIIEAGDIFLNSHPEAEIELVIPRNPSKMRRKVEKCISAKSCSSGFRITGTLPYQELVEKLYKATAVLIPSHNEGFCFAAAEASFLGIPVITSDHGALKETAGGKIVIIDELTPEGLFNAMERASAGNYTDREVRLFPLEDQVRKYLDLYRSI